DLTVLGAEVASFRSRRGSGGLDQRPAKPRVAVGRADAASLARGFVVARAQADPGREIARGREPRHVGAGLSDDHVDRVPVEAWHRQEQPVDRCEDGGTRIDLLGQRRERLVEEVEVTEDATAGDGVVGAEVPGQCLGQRRDLRAQSYTQKLWTSGASGAAY